MLLLEALLVLGAHRHHGAAVDLVERGEDGGGVLGGDEPLGDPLADAGHRHPLLALPGGPRHGASDGGGRRRGGHGRRGLRDRLAALEVRQESPLVRRPPLPDAGIAPGSRPCSSIRLRTAGLSGPTGRAEAGAGRRPANSPRPAPPATGGAGAGAGVAAAAAAGLAACAFVLDASHDVARDDRLAFLLQHAEHAGALRGQLRGGLVALDLEQHVVGRDGVAVVLRPARDRRLGDRFPEARDADLEHHPPQARAKARVTSSVSSAWCTLYDPLAGLAAASRPTYVERAPAEQRS